VDLSQMDLWNNFETIKVLLIYWLLIWLNSFPPKNKQSKKEVQKAQDIEKDKPVEDFDSIAY
jgi:hypothetical protein